MSTEILNPVDSVELASTAALAKWRSVIFTSSGDVEDGSGLARSVALTVGIFDDAKSAWCAAREAARVKGAFGHTIVRIETPSTEFSAARTIDDARRIVAGLRHLVQEGLPKEQTEMIGRALDALDETLVRGWTEVDESLVRLIHASRMARRRGDDELEDHISTAVGFLHRWQGRNGRVGNVG